MYVVNSACHSVLQGPLDTGVQRSSSQLQPIQFGCAVSPRLSAHAFLHGLVRAGYTKKADTYARLMMRAGIPIRARTLESVVSSLVSRSPSLPKFGPFARVIPRKPAIYGPSVMQLRSNRVSDQCTRAAITLLQEARIFGQQRTERMYKVLFGTLLMQGEIIVASLLFVLLLKDFEVRKREVIDNEDPGGPNYITHDNLRISLPSRAALANTPFPNPKFMGKILDVIDAGSDPTVGSRTSQSLQSLAIFAMLLDTGQIGHPRVCSVISSLYRCPRSTANVWILQDGRPRRVNAYAYFHHVLKRLIDSLAAPDPGRRTPWLTRRAYNTLLSYALRHRLSPEMASTVLHHMCVARESPIKPDIVTYNILLRSGTLLQKIEISEATLEALRQGAKAGTLQMMFRELEARTAKPLDTATVAEADDAAEPNAPDDEEGDRDVDVSPAPRNATELTGPLRRLQAETLILPDRVRKPEGKLKADRYTLSTFVTHLTSTGQPQAVAEMLFKVLPELAIVRHPAKGTALEERVPFVNRAKALKRAVAHGPYVYASLISALTKAGEIGLAESVLILAQRAERASQIGLAPNIPPWRLTVHAYTAMMQGYAAAAHDRIPLRKRHPSYVGTKLMEPRDPRGRALTHRHHQGYAKLVHMFNEQDQRDRGDRTLTKPQLSRRNAALLYRSMRSGGRALLGALIPNSKVIVTRGRYSNLPQEGYQVQLDARFFNAALELFAPRPGRLAQHRRSRAWWQHRLQRAMRKGRSRAAPKVDVMMCKLAKAMVASGFEVPVGYRHLLAGRVPVSGLQTRRPRRVLVRRPYAFPTPKKDCFEPYSIPTFKTRGLPVRRRRMGRMLRAAKGLSKVDNVT